MERLRQVIEALDNGQALNNKGAMAYKSTTDPVVDFYFQLVRDINRTDLITLFTKAFEYNPEYAMRVVAQSRDCRGGKGDRRPMHLLFEALVQNPTTKRLVESNLEVIASEYGYWKDLLPYVLTTNSARSVIASQIHKDYIKYLEGEPISLAIKYFPREGNSHDRKGHLYEVLVNAFTDLLSRDPIEGLIIRSKRDFRKKVMVPMTAYLKVVEVYMSSGKWDQIEIAKIPSRCLSKVRKALERHLPEKMEEFKRMAEADITIVKHKSLYPHELLRKVMESDEVSTLQWKAKEAEITSKERKNSFFPLIDTSGSMSGLPMDIAVSLGVMISRTQADPCLRGLFCSFEETPHFVSLNPRDTIARQLKTAMGTPWGGTTNLESAMQQLVLACKNGGMTKLPNLLILSDMQFDALSGSRRTNMDYIQKLCTTNGFEMPYIVLWNLQAPKGAVSFPATVNHEKVLLVSGFSTSVLDAILAGDLPDAKKMVYDILGNERYSMVKV